MKSYFFPGFLFCANYGVIVTTNFSRCCGWLLFAAQPKLLFFYSGHPDVCIAIIIIIIIIILLVKLQASNLAQVLKPITLFKTCIRI